MRPREATKAADEAKARFAHIDGADELELEFVARNFLYPRMC